jgi:hypothetical protein
MRRALATEKRNKQPAVTKDHQDSEYPQEHALQDVGVYWDCIVVGFIFLRVANERMSSPPSVPQTFSFRRIWTGSQGCLWNMIQPSGHSILSEPAANRRQWAIQTLKRAYQQTGRTNVSWDAKVETAFEAFVDYTRVSTTNWATLEKALAALASTGCDDP